MDVVARRLLLLLLLFVGLCLANRRRHFDEGNSLSSSASSSATSDENGFGDDRRAHGQPVGRVGMTLHQLNAYRPTPQAEKLSGQALVDYVNRRQGLWRANLSEKFESYDEGVKWRLMGVNHVRNSIKAMKQLGKTRFLDMDLPDAFDARQQWPACSSIRAIRDQSSCGSCWAFGAVEAMSDRTCIASGGKIQVSISADDLLSCCHTCGFGCDGGDPLAAWKYWVKHGIVTGSNFTAHQGCRPYPFPPCEHHSNKTHYQPCKHDLYPTPKCEHKCQGSYGLREYQKDKFYGKSAYAVDSTVKAIQNELYVNGPLEIAFEVYEDFLSYTGGVYFHTGGKLGGGHAVKLIGWGVDNSIPYWLVANSWNTDWGEDGFFRIVRGKDECGIESGVVGGVPDLARSPKSGWQENAEDEDEMEEEQVQPRHPHRHHRLQQDNELDEE